MRFPGLRQMLWRWDGAYPLDVFAPDYWTTYYGGWGLYSYSMGIDDAIDQTLGSVIGAMGAAGTPASVPTHLFCGAAAEMPGWHNEHTGPSDGTVCSWRAAGIPAVSARWPEAFFWGPSITSSSSGRARRWPRSKPGCGSRV